MQAIGRTSFAALCLVFSLSVGSLAFGAEPLPEFYGFYAVDKGMLHEFDKSSNLLEGDFSPQVRFILFEKAVGVSGLLTGEVRLSRYKFVRNVREPADPNDFSAGNCIVRAEKVWKATDDAARQIELRAKPVPGQPEMIMLVPREPLPPGGYFAKTGQGSLAKFFVERESLFANLESTDDCVDEERFVSGGISAFYQRLNNSSTEIACSQSTLKAGSTGPCRAGSSTSPAAPGFATVGQASLTAEAVEAQKTLANEVYEYLQRPPSTSEEAMDVFTDEKAGVSVSYPAGFEVARERPPILARFMAPLVTGDGGSSRPNITVTNSPTPLLNRNPTLDSVVQATLTGTINSVSDSVIGGPFDTKMAGFDAQVFFVTGVERGVPQKKAVTVAVGQRRIMGAVLHASPDAFADLLEAYRGVCNSYSLR